MYSPTFMRHGNNLGSISSVRDKLALAEAFGVRPPFRLEADSVWNHAWGQERWVVGIVNPERGRLLVAYEAT